MIDADLTARLENGERLLWAGRPAQGLLLTGRDWLLIPFSLLWCSFLVIFVATAITQEEPLFFLVFSVPFLIVGAYILVGRFALDAFLRRGMRYAVTNRRILIERPAPFARSTSLRIDRLPQLDLSERAKGKGTILFGPPALGMTDLYFGYWTPALNSTPQFLAIDDARRVFDLIQKTAGEDEVKG